MILGWLVVTLATNLRPATNLSLPNVIGLHEHLRPKLVRTRGANFAPSLPLQICGRNLHQAQTLGERLYLPNML